MRTLFGLALFVGLFVNSSALAQQSRLASPTGSNAKAPPTKAPPSKPKVAAKAAAVTTSKSTPPAAASGKSAGTTSSSAQKAPATGGVASAVKTPTKVVATPASATKTVAGTTKGEKVTVAKPATITRPATAVATEKPPTADPADPSKPVAPVATAKPVVLPPDKKPDIGKAVEGLAAGTLSSKDFTALLAGGGLTSQQLAALLASGALPPGTELAQPEPKPTEVATNEKEVPPPSSDFSLPVHPMPAVTEAARFKAWTWEAVDRGQTDFQLPMEWVVLYYLNPQMMAQKMLERPVGQRVLFTWDLERDLIGNPADFLQVNLQLGAPAGAATTCISPWPEQGIAIVRERMTNFINAFADAGGTLDAFIVDYETDFWWGLLIGGNGGQAQIDAIEQDPRFPALAAELGFDDLNLIQGENDKFVRWNQVMGGRFDAALDYAFYQPIRARFPNAAVSNYRSFSCDAANPTPWCTGVVDLRQTAGFGSHDARAYYGLVSTELSEKRLDASNQPVGIDPYSGLRLQVHGWRAMDLASTRPMHAWIAPANNPPDEYSHTVTRTLDNNPYYDEMVFQFGASGCETFLYWNPASWLPIHNPVHWNRLDDQVRLDGCLRELNQVLGQTPGAVVPTRGPSFGDRVVASGRQVGDRMVWRFTFAPGINSVVVRFSDGTSKTVTKEANRPGAWLSYPASMTIQMNSTFTAPEMVIGPSA